MSCIIPEGLFDGQIYVDCFRVKWVYSSEQNCWKREGRTETIPIADGINSGLLPQNLKILLDEVPEKGGGYAIITDPRLSQRTVHNPDGVIFGNIDLVSDSINIACVLANGRQIGEKCVAPGFNENDSEPPGFDLTLSETFLNTLCISVPGGLGLPGREGEKGNPGAPGTGDGPVGLQGDPGRDASVRHKLNAVRIVDVDDVFDTAVVKLELDQPNGTLFVTKAKLSGVDGVVADQLVAKQISRGILFKNCWDYDIVMQPCVIGDDFDVVDPLIAYLPEHFKPDCGSNQNELRGFQPVRAKFSTLIDDIITVYKKKLDSEATGIDSELGDFINSKDGEARGILDGLVDKLAECENITYLDYCVGIGPPCNQPPSSSTSDSGSGGGDIPISPGICATDSESLEIAQFAECQNDCIIKLGTRALSLLPFQFTEVGVAPILAFNMPDPTNARYQNPPSGNCGGTPAYFDALKSALNNSHVVHKIFQIPFRSGIFSFPIGTYVFVYKTGGFFQFPLSEAYLDPMGIPRSQTLGFPASILRNGAFRKCYVGNEGNGAIIPAALNDFCGARYMNVSAALASTEIGVEIGVAPDGFSSAFPTNYFDPLVSSSGSSVPTNLFTTYPVKHGAVSLFESGRIAGPGEPPPYDNQWPGAFFPNPRIDFVGLTQYEISNMQQIQWKKFPATPAGSSYASQPQLSGNVTEQQVTQQFDALKNAYLDGDISIRAVKFEITQPSTLWFRCKQAFNGVNAISQLVMPQSKRNDDYARFYGSLPKSYNVALVTGVDQTSYISINAQPVAFGEVSFNLYQVDCK